MHLDEAQSEKQKDTIRQRCASYLDRAEKVKEYLKVILMKFVGFHEVKFLQEWSSKSNA